MKTCINVKEKEPTNEKLISVCMRDLGTRKNRFKLINGGPKSFTCSVLGLTIYIEKSHLTFKLNVC